MGQVVWNKQDDNDYKVACVHTSGKLDNFHAHCSASTAVVFSHMMEIGEQFLKL